MSARSCGIDGCLRAHSARGLCRPHYRQMKRRQAAARRPARPTLAQRFWSRVTVTDGCWEWTGCRNPDGYGVFNIGMHGKSEVAHRLAYKLLVGPIPAGLHLDHLCENTGCVSPAHLEPVTPAENNRRSLASRGGKRKRSNSYGS